MFACFLLIFSRLIITFAFLATAFLCPKSDRNHLIWFPLDHATELLFSEQTPKRVFLVTTDCLPFVSIFFLNIVIWW